MRLRSPCLWLLVSLVAGCAGAEDGSSARLGHEPDRDATAGDAPNGLDGGGDGVGEGPADGDVAEGNDAADGDGAVADVSVEPSCDGFELDESTGRLPDVVTEASGLAWAPEYPDVLWAHNDSGDGPYVYAFGFDGVLLATITLDGVVARDWEDMAIGACGGGEGTCIYVGDIGDNGRSRSSVALHRFVMPDPTLGDATVEALSITRAYPDGPRDAEALLTDAEGRVYVLSKETGEYGVYRADFEAETGVFEAVGRGTFEGLAMSGAQTLTAADWDEDRGLLIRTYGMAAWAADADLDDASAWTFERVPTGPELQGEAIAWTDSGYVHAAEGRSSAIYALRCRSDAGDEGTTD